jgi:hypothetical protein
MTAHLGVVPDRRQPIGGSPIAAIDRSSGFADLVTILPAQLKNDFSSGELRWGRKNHLFAGSDAGGDLAAAMYTIVRTAKLTDINWEAYLRDTIAKIADAHPITSHRRIDALMSR